MLQTNRQIAAGGAGSRTMAEADLEPWRAGPPLGREIICRLGLSLIPSLLCHVTPLSAEFTPRGRESTPSLTGLSRGAHGAVQASSSPVPATADHKRETRLLSAIDRDRQAEPDLHPEGDEGVMDAGLARSVAFRPLLGTIGTTSSRPGPSRGRLMSTNPVRDAPLHDSRAKIA
jgi:hypothetical protein